MRTLPFRTAEQDHKTCFITPFQNNSISFCGHKIDIQRPPRTNCVLCWTYFFLRNAPFAEDIKAAIKIGNRAALVKEHGNDLVKQAEKFFARIDELRTEQQKVAAELPPVVVEQEGDTDAA